MVLMLSPDISLVYVVLQMFVCIALISYIGTYRMSATDKILRLPAFGFLKGGEFYFRFFGQNVSNLKTYLLPQEYEGAFGKFIKVRQVCNGLLETRAYSNSSGTNAWSGYINRSVVLVPVILNCGQPSRLSISARLTNPESFADSRDTFLPQLHFGLTFVYGVIGLLFMINQITHLKYCVGLHSLFTCCAVMKMLCCYVVGAEYETIAKMGKITPVESFLQPSLCVTTHGILFLANGLSVLGYGTTKEYLSFIDVVKVGLPSFLFFLVGSIPTSSVVLSSLFVLIKAISVCSYVYIMTQSIVSCLDKYRNALRDSEPLLCRKFELVITFTQYVARFVVIQFFLWACISMRDMSRLIRNIDYEMFILGVFVIDCICFFYRNTEAPYRETNLLTNLSGRSINAIQDPIGTYYC